MLPAGSGLARKWREARLLALALYLVASARAVLATRGFGDPRVNSGEICDGPPAQPSFARRTNLAISRAARFVPGAACLAQAIAGRKLLALKGCSSRIIVGVRSSEEAGMEAHAWLVSGDMIVLGGNEPELDRFSPIIGPA